MSQKGPPSATPRIGVVSPKRKNSAHDPGGHLTPSSKPTTNAPPSSTKAPTHTRNSKLLTQTRAQKLSSSLASPRKNSAPPSLLSSQIGESLGSLPNASTVRRKISTPVRPNPPHCPQSAPKSQPKKKVPCIVAAFPKKPASSVQTSDVPDRSRMSKDHHTTTNSGPQTTTATAVGTEGKSKKGGALSDLQPLPTLKEEKKSKSTKQNKKPVPKRQEAYPEPLQETPFPQAASFHPAEMEPPQAEELLPPLTTCADVEIAKGPLDAAPQAKDFFLENEHLRKTMSDLVKNNEIKKQEIAALKIEINRLKEAARERSHQLVASEGRKDLSTTPVVNSIQEAPTVNEDARVNVGQLEGLIESLTAENKLLREHLKQFGVSLDSSPLSDQQKEMILNRVSALSQTVGSGDGAGCALEREWDNKSSSSISEISVACLQGRIQQMEETHYSTNEELQATLQELDDLKEQLAESHAEVQQLQEEKQVILESLTQQTEKLTEARGHNDTLKSMLIQHSENSEDLSQCERTQRLMELLKSVQEDRELISVKQEELERQLFTSKETEEHFHRETQRIRERMKLLEAMVEDANGEKKSIESQALETRESLKASEKEISRLKASLQASKEKIVELEATVISGEKSELADVLERVCGEKESLEKESSALHKKVNGLVCENERLKEQMNALQDDLRVTRNNAKTNLDDVEYKRIKLDEKRLELEREVEDLKASIAELQMTCQCHLEDKRELKASLSESQKKLAEMLERQADAERGFAEERALFNKQVEEWEQFQRDLLTTVRVANDFKTEAQHDLERLLQENHSLKDRLKILDQELEKARVTTKLPSSASTTINTSPSLSSTSSLGGASNDRRLFRSVSHVPNGGSILNDRRSSNPRPLERGDSRVKSLIESIECATKQARAGSRSSSTSSLASTSSETNNNNTNKNNSALKRTDTDGGGIRNLPSTLASLPQLKDSIAPSPSPLRTINCNTFADPLSQTFPPTKTQNSNLPDNVKITQLSNEKTSKYNGFYPSSPNGDPVSKPVSILASKIEPIRRNSYGQISSTDKKDPLASLAQSGGSKRNALLKWCQMKTVGYNHVDITNFSSSWNDGMALCALLDSYLPDRINYNTLNPNAKKKNFEVAINAAESVGIPTTLDTNNMLTMERPSWQMVFNYVTSIYCHFET